MFMLNIRLLGVVLCIILCKKTYSIDADICQQTLEDKYVKQITWNYLKDCLIILSGQDMPQETAENIWRLLKLVYFYHQKYFITN